MKPILVPFALTEELVIPRAGFASAILDILATPVSAQYALAAALAMAFVNR
jgi:hypothetical protein